MLLCLSSTQHVTSGYSLQGVKFLGGRGLRERNPGSAGKDRQVPRCIKALRRNRKGGSGGITAGLETCKGSPSDLQPHEEIQ